jgi:flagellin-specific chaperone FliS
MNHRLLLGSLRNDPAPLEEVRRLLQDLKGAWDEIAQAPRPAAVTAVTAIHV